MSVSVIHLPSSLSVGDEQEPLGTVLVQAALVSSAQIDLALQDQSYFHDHLKIGEVLALRGWVKQETADFFAHWFWIRQQPKRPLGYYLKAAALLSYEQIEAILNDQKITGLRFGEAAVLKGQIKQKTADFFLDELNLRQV